MVLTASHPLAYPTRDTWLVSQGCLLCLRCRFSVHSKRTLFGSFPHIVDVVRGNRMRGRGRNCCNSSALVNQVGETPVLSNMGNAFLKHYTTLHTSTWLWPTQVCRAWMGLPYSWVLSFNGKPVSCLRQVQRASSANVCAMLWRQLLDASTVAFIG